MTDHVHQACRHACEQLRSRVTKSRPEPAQQGAALAYRQALNVEVLPGSLQALACVLISSGACLALWLLPLSLRSLACQLSGIRQQP